MSETFSNLKDSMAHTELKCFPAGQFIPHRNSCLCSTWYKEIPKASGLWLHHIPENKTNRGVLQISVTTPGHSSISSRGIDLLKNNDIDF